VIRIDAAWIAVEPLDIDERPHGRPVRPLGVGYAVPWTTDADPTMSTSATAVPPLSD
jgi:hypothetical protein